MAFNLPAESRELAEGVPPDEGLPNGTLQGQNDFGKLGYGGPAPPPGKPHQYHFKLYALDQTLESPAGASKEELQAAMKDHVLAEAELVGTYSR